LGREIRGQASAPEHDRENEDDENDRGEHQRLLNCSGRREMKDEGGDDACPDGKDCARSPVREDTKGEYDQGGQYRDFDNDRNHRDFPLLRSVAVLALQVRKQEYQRQRQRPDDRGDPRPVPEAAPSSLGQPAGQIDRKHQ
jgi:hypothetical protein